MRATEQQAKGVVYNLELKVGQTDCLKRVEEVWVEKQRKAFSEQLHIGLWWSSVVPCQSKLALPLELFLELLLCHGLKDPLSSERFHLRTRTYQKLNKSIDVCSPDSLPSLPKLLATNSVLGKKLRNSFCMANLKLVVLLLLPLAVAGFSLFGKKKTTTEAPVDPNAAKKEELKWIAIAEINKKSKDLLNLVPVEVVSFQENNFRKTMQIKVAQASCLKRAVAQEELQKELKGKCKLKKNGKQFLYTVEIFKRAWEKFQSVTIKSIKNL
uniref:Cystatin domain-containing protein n=1 Tax=Steinernema glaseri TaxID=37863 RepID=A0A1I8ABJ7_9BILA